MGAYREEWEEGLTVLDRLLWQPEHADEIGRSGDPLLHSIGRDLEVLMNSRRDEGWVIEECPAVGSSILNFGIPALGRYGDIGLAAEQTRLCRSIEEAIRTFEPRLRRPQVRVMERDVRQKSVLRLRLRASVAEMEPKDIFQIALKPETGEMTVSAAGDA